MDSEKKRIHLIGFGSQGAAWAQCLRHSGWQVEVYLRSLSARGELARSLGFSPKPLEDLSESLKADPWTSPWIALLIPDDQIGPFYERWLRSQGIPLTLFLAHGYAVHTGALAQLSSGHTVRLMAPKSIGPKLSEAFAQAFPQPHQLSAAVTPAGSNGELDPLCTVLGNALGFSRDRMIPVSFETETIGDLLSEQLLLCGGLATLLEQTVQAMRSAGVPDALIREECITELSLIAGMLQERGVEGTFQKISPTALRGAARARTELLRSGLPEACRNLAAQVLDGRFMSYEKSARCDQEVAELRAALAELSPRRKNHT